MRRFAAVWVGLILSCNGMEAIAAEFRSAPRFDPPAENFSTPQALQSLQGEIERGAFADAAMHLDGLLREHADEFTSLDGQGLISIATWIDLLPMKQKTAVSEEYRGQFDAPARGVFDALRHDATGGPESAYALARRYPLGSTAVAAYVLAGDRSAEIGDAEAVVTFYGLARRCGWTADKDRAARLATCEILAWESAERRLPAGDKGGNEAASPMSQYRGPVVFDAAWYGRVEGVGMAKYLPVAVDGILYLAGPRNVLAMNDNGQVVWRWAAAEAWARTHVADRMSTQGRGPVYAPAVFASPAGAQIVVVRQPRGIGRDFGLRAFRASDGKLLWSTESNNELNHISFASAPALCGRCLYATAVEFTENSGTLILASLELLSGRVIFKCALGSMLDMRRAREDPRGWDRFWEQTEPAVEGDKVYVTPNVGIAFAIGRFDGKLRWMQSYEELPDLAGRRGRAGRIGRFEEPERQAVPTNAGELSRYRGTPQVCGGAVVIAPQDTGAAFGLEVESGRLLWKTIPLRAPTLIGHSGVFAIFAGRAVLGVNAATGKIEWGSEPPVPIRIGGPCAVVNGTVYVPTSDFKVGTLSPESGRSIDVKLMQPDFRKLINSAGGKRALEDAMILRSFGYDSANPPGGILE